MRIPGQRMSHSQDCPGSFLHPFETNIPTERCQSHTPDLHGRLRGGILHEGPWLCRLRRSKPQGSKWRLGKRDSQEDGHRLCTSFQADVFPQDSALSGVHNGRGGCQPCWTLGGSEDLSVVTVNWSLRGFCYLCKLIFNVLSTL